MEASPAPRDPERRLTAAAAVMTGALLRARAAGLGLDRLSAAAGWAPDTVRALLDHADAADPDVVARAGSASEALERIDELLRRIAADLADDAWSPASADLDDLHERLETQWRSWRDGLGRRA